MYSVEVYFIINVLNPISWVIIDLGGRGMKSAVIIILTHNLLYKGFISQICPNMDIILAIYSYLA